jgi:lipopolysaccharide transport system permease protein
MTGDVAALAPAEGPAREVVIQPTKGWAALKLGEVWEYRDLLYFLIWRDLKGRYRQTALGPLWFVLQPLMSMVLYSLIFGSIARLPSDNQPYTVFTYVALLPWGFFSNAVSAGTNSLLGSIGLISKVYFPRLIAPLAQMLSSLVDMAISLIILALMLVYFQARPTWGIVLLPVYLAIMGALGMGLGLWFSGIIVRFRDFGQIVGFLVRVMMYLSPVVYAMSLIEAQFPQWLWLYRLNPVTVVIDGFRWALLGSGYAPDWTLAVAAGVAGLVLVGGLYMFKRVERTIVDIA